MRAMKSVLRSFLALALLVAASSGCSSGDDGTLEGTTVDSKTITIGLTAQEVNLGTPTRGATVVFPAGVTRAMTSVQVNLNDRVRKRQAVPAGGVVEIATMAIAFDTPARMRQPLPTPPAGRSYVAVTAQRQSDTWTVKRDGVRVVQGGGMPNPDLPDAGGSLMGGEADGGIALEMQPQLAQADVVLTTYEIDVTGTGYWAIALEDIPPVAGGGTGSCADALAKFTSCGFSFQPAGVNPCDSADAETDACSFKCFNQATCTQLTGLYCSATPPTLQDAIVQCISQCEESKQGGEIACGTEEFYTAFDRCDGFADCSDGADEVGCATFACGDGTTTPVGNKCDGFSDCANGADEVGCPPEPELYCPNGMPSTLTSSDEDL